MSEGAGREGQRSARLPPRFLAHARNDTRGLHVALGVLRQGAKWIIVALLVMGVVRVFGALEYPDVATAEVYARELMTKLAPAQLDNALVETPADIPLVLRTLGSAMMTRDLALQMRVTRYLGELVALRARRADRNTITFLVVDPVRFTRDAAFRARILPLLPKALDSTYSAALRNACLSELNGPFALDFDTAESVAASWGSIAHRSSERRIDLTKDLRMPDDFSPIETSIYSINSDFFPTSDDARAFLSAVRASAPKRRILVLADSAMNLSDIRVEILPTFGRVYTPWPRDPFTAARAKEGGVVLINRPNLQPHREEDANMARALTQGNFAAQWTVAPIPFHNGHILLTPNAAWISIHTVEIRALQLQGINRVPVQSFATKEGIEKYLVAVRKAAKELEALYRKPVRFVHPLAADPALMKRLGGGGGFDLDSVMTLLPQSDGSLVALVGDFSLGAKYKPNKVFGTVAAPPQGLQRFLDTIAAHLTANGINVKRLPLLNMRSKDAPEEFLLTWNNVVLEPARAEGFAMLLPEGDAYARKVFANAGYQLELFPPLAKSVKHSGGYRCASNHVRR